MLRGRTGTVAWLALVLVFAVPLCRRSINLSDEGYILLQAFDMLEGRVLYRDMDAFVSPGIWFLLAGLFKLVEPSVLASRALSLASFVATAALTFRIVDLTTRRTLAWLSTGVFVVMAVWAFPIWTWTFYSPFAVLFAMCALERLLVFSRRARTTDLVWLGVWLGLAITFKQNYGTFALLGSLVALGVLRVTGAREGSQALPGPGASLGAVAIGGAAIGVPVFGYLIANGAVVDAFRSLVVHPFVFAGQHDVAYLGFASLFDPFVLDGTDRLTYGASSLYRIVTPIDVLRELRIVERMHVGLYLMPPALFAIAAVVLWRKRASFDRDLFAVGLIAGAVFLGVFPRADYNHLLNVYQPVLILAMLVLDRCMGDPAIARWLGKRGVRAVAGFVVASYVIVAVYWYAQIVITMDAEITPRRGGVLERPEIAQRLNQLTEVVWANTRPGDPLLSVPDLAMLNFLAERSMPSPYYNLYQHHIAHDGGAAVVDGSRANGVRFAVARYNGFFSDRDRLRDYAPTLIDHLDRDFAIQFTAGGDNFVFLHRRPRPAPKRETVRLLEHCMIEPEVDAGIDHQVREHLLFSTLYQDEGDHHDEAEWTVESRCRIQLPDDPTLLFGVRPDYYPPRDAEPGASLDFEVWVERSGYAPEKVLDHQVPVVKPPHLRLIRYWPGEQRADLGRFAGEEVTLVFRGRRRGRVEQHPLAFRSYSTMWIDPRLLGAVTP
ncbi:MAG: hypothetical protein QF570_07015 [Myxococcota bacterium]|jgi:hypothetical protein|nr:hypothetical protein [Myxococcota bacterium]